MVSKNRLGELSELMFQLRAGQQGWIVSRPCTEKELYDYIIDTRRHLLRVQVKSSVVPCSKGRYHINLGRGSGSKIPYTKQDIDFFAIHLVPEDTWYILPVEAAAGRVGLTVPKLGHHTGTQCEQYLEAWALMANPRTDRRATDRQPTDRQPALCQTKEIQPTGPEPPKPPAKSSRKRRAQNPTFTLLACAQDFDPRLARKQVVQ